MSRKKRRAGRTAKRRDNVMHLASARHHQVPPEAQLDNRVHTRTSHIEAGETVRPYRMVDTVGVLVRNGTIPEELAWAARKFRDTFEVAYRDALKAPALLRVASGPRGGPSDAILDAREEIWRIQALLGGPRSPAASLAWFVLGGDSSLREWSERAGVEKKHNVQEKPASGMLVATLWVIHGYFEEKERGRRRVSTNGGD